MDRKILKTLERLLRKENTPQISQDRLLELLESLLPPCHARLVLSLLFSALDIENTGYIDLGETQNKQKNGGQLKDILEIISERIEQQDQEEDKLQSNLSWLFRMFDIKGCGGISIFDFMDIFCGLHAIEGLDKREAEIQAMRVFSVLDADQDGEVTQDEFVRKCLDDRTLVSEIMETETVSGGITDVRNSRSLHKRTSTLRKYQSLCQFQCAECTYDCRSKNGMELHTNKKHGGGRISKTAPFRPAVTDRLMTPN